LFDKLIETFYKAGDILPYLKYNDFETAQQNS